jgi:hypothetical protein
VIVLIDPANQRPSDCPEFDYEDHPNWQTVLSFRVTDALADLARGVSDTRVASLDTRPTHLRFFGS